MIFETVESVIMYIYKGSILINSENVKSILALSHFLGVESLLKKAISYITLLGVNFSESRLKSQAFKKIDMIEN